MVIGPKVNVSRKELNNLSQFIQEKFDKQVNIKSIHSLEEGVNFQTHFVALTSTEQKYGMKVCDRGITNGTAKEKVIGDLSAKLEAPNFCRVYQYDGISELEGLKDWDKVNIIEWLDGAKSLKYTPPNEVKKCSTEFFEQYGEWSYFALTFGVVDRHFGNWVWSSEDEKLSMIDNQDAFNEIGPTHIRPSAIVGKYSDIDKFGMNDSPDFSHFNKGLNNMHKKVQSRQEKIEEVLSSWSFTKEYKPKYFDLSFPEILSEISQCF